MKTIKIFSLLFVLTGFFYRHYSYAQTPNYLSSITQNLKSPVRVAIDGNDIIYVTDAFQKKIVKFDISGNFIGTITPGGSPISVAVNKENQLFIGDSETGNILKLNSNETVSVFYSGALFPTSMVFSPDNLLYVVDSKLQHVIVLDATGTVVKTIGTGNLIFPTGIAYDNKNNRILISEHGGIGADFNPVVKIWIYDLQGILISSFGSHGNGNGQFYRIQDLTISRCGNIYVPDPFQGNISIFDENGVYISKFGEFGVGSGKLNVPLDVLIDSHDRMLVTSMNNGALEVYNITYNLPTSNIIEENKSICQGSSINIPIQFTGSAPWNFTYTINEMNPANITTSDNPFMLDASLAGTYNVISLSDLNNSGTCFSGKTNIIVNPLPVSDFTFNDFGLDVNFLNNSSNANTFIWGFGDNSASTEANPAHSYQSAGEYTVTLTATNGICTDNTFSTIVSIIETSVGNNRFKNIVDFFPNPSTGKISLKINNSVNSDLSIEISNIAGKDIYSEIIRKSSDVKQIDLSSYSKGIYIVKIKSNNYTKTTKLVLNE